MRLMIAFLFRRTRKRGKSMHETLHLNCRTYDKISPASSSDNIPSRRCLPPHLDAMLLPRSAHPRNISNLRKTFCGLRRTILAEAQTKINGNEESSETKSASRQMRKQIQTYKLISKLSNFRGLLKHLPEVSSLCCQASLYLGANLLPRAVAVHVVLLNILCLRHKFLPFRLKFVFASGVCRTMTSLHLF